MFDRNEFTERFRAMIERGERVVGGGAGTGLMEVLA